MHGKNDVVLNIRANQGRYLNQARNGEDVIIKSRDHGSFKITPVTKDDTVYSMEELDKKINISMEQFKNGDFIEMGENESAEEFVNRMLCIQ